MVPSSEEYLRRNIQKVKSHNDRIETYRFVEDLRNIKTSDYAAVLVLPGNTQIPILPQGDNVFIVRLSSKPISTVSSQ